MTQLTQPGSIVNADDAQNGAIVQPLSDPTLQDVASGKDNAMNPTPSVEQRQQTHRPVSPRSAEPKVTLPYATVSLVKAAALNTLPASQNECLLIPTGPIMIVVPDESALDVQRQIRAYSVSWFAPDQPWQAVSDDSAEMLLVQIDPDWLSTRCQQLDANFKRPAAPMIDAVHPDIPLLGGALVRLLATTDGSQETFLPPMLHWLVSRCACELDSRGQKSAPVTLGDAELQATLQEIEERLPDAVPVSELAATLGMSNSRYSRAFKASVGCPPSRYVLERRVSHARRLLETTAMSLIDITFDSGFSSQSHMTFVFVKELGVTPGQYRRSCTQQGRALDTTME